MKIMIMIEGSSYCWHFFYPTFHIFITNCGTLLSDRAKVNITRQSAFQNREILIMLLNQTFHSVTHSVNVFDSCEVAVFNIVRPLFNAPPYNRVLGITNDIL